MKSQTMPLKDMKMFTQHIILKNTKNDQTLNNKKTLIFFIALMKTIIFSVIFQFALY